MGYRSVIIKKCYTCGKKFNYLDHDTGHDICATCKSQTDARKNLMRQRVKDQDEHLQVGMYFKKINPENEEGDLQDYILIAYGNGLYVFVKKIGDINFIYENHHGFFVDYEKTGKKLTFEVTDEQIQ